jgi:hypothetical protein
MRCVSVISIIVIWFQSANKAKAFVLPHCQSFPSSSFAFRLCSTKSNDLQRLQDGLINVNHVMTTEFFAKSPLLKQFYAKLTKAIEVRKSSIPGAGLGLFAKKPIKAHTIVSFYPAHALGTNDETQFVTSSPEDASYFATHPSSRSPYLHCTDQPIFGRPSLLHDEIAHRELDLSSKSTGPVVPLFLDINPHREVRDGWVSHYINDGAVITSKTEQGVLHYYQASKRSKNCIHIPFGPSPIIATVTTKKVAKDEELLTMYGGVSFLCVRNHLRHTNDELNSIVYFGISVGVLVGHFSNDEWPGRRGGCRNHSKNPSGNQ